MGQQPCRVFHSAAHRGYDFISLMAGKQPPCLLRVSAVSSRVLNDKKRRIGGLGGAVPRPSNFGVKGWLPNSSGPIDAGQYSISVDPIMQMALETHIVVYDHKGEWP